MSVLKGFLLCLLIAGVHNAPQMDLPAADLMHFDVLMDDMIPCPDSEESSFTMSDIELEFYNRTQLLVNGKLIVKEKLDSLKGRFELTKCDSKQQVDSCQFVMSTDINNICEKLPEKGSDWEPFMMKIKDFDPECPLEPGTYDIEAAPLDTSTFQDNPVLYGYWIADFVLLVNGEFGGCNRISASIVKKRRRGGRAL
ncbi:uncharacterized protein [Anabrus simplex]|uniref:uncharacterized protein n=1 Tax=Anabrus simplex TaxID=316456 RepID=UPI0035A3902B